MDKKQELSKVLADLEATAEAYVKKKQKDLAIKNGEINALKRKTTVAENALKAFTQVQQKKNAAQK